MFYVVQRWCWADFTSTLIDDQGKEDLAQQIGATGDIAICQCITDICKAGIKRIELNAVAHDMTEASVAPSNRQCDCTPPLVCY